MNWTINQKQPSRSCSCGEGLQRISMEQCAEMKMLNWTCSTTQPRILKDSKVKSNQISGYTGQLVCLWGLFNTSELNVKLSKSIFWGKLVAQSQLECLKTLYVCNSTRYLQKGSCLSGQYFLFHVLVLELFSYSDSPLLYVYVFQDYVQKVRKPQVCSC